MDAEHAAFVNDPDLHLKDEEIVRRVLEGERALFELLMRRNNQRLYRILRAILKADDCAEEALQSTYVKAYFNLGSFSGEGSFAGWIGRIAVREAYAGRRKMQQEPPIDPEAIEQSANPTVRALYEPQEAHVMSRELNSIIVRALDALPEDQRTVFVLREVEQLSGAETAEYLEITPENVRVRLHRAKQALRGLIERQLGNELAAVFEFGKQRCDAVVLTVLDRIAAGR